MKLLKSLSCLCLIWGLLVILTGCPQISDTAENPKPLGMVNYTYFDTVSFYYCYSGDSQDVFEARTEIVSSLLWE